ncbi:YoaK family protein [Prauserella cavernicola]|uniref:DUF1275 domain-containing protein n=1 Tax=Prauserella cavernicola TaxID=2800127 RepID=A0A934V665_9PSEU|nr:YoaK family protein [Prauserella cavernicola]MBK1787212.1 DUF1275 domain-containing protein [Prauserella cavernicola]
MLALTFSTGIADAVGYLALDKVFTGNMTGNVVILGMGAAGTAGLPVAGPLVALASFMVGAAAGGRATRGQPAGWTRRTTFLIGLVGVMFAAAAGLFAIPLATESPGVAHVVTVVLAAAMGLQAAVARRIAVQDVTTVVVTSTITGLSADSRFGAGLQQPWPRRAGAILLIGAGAAVGALLVHLSEWLSAAVPAVLTVAVAVTGHLLVRKHPV